MIKAIVIVVLAFNALSGYACCKVSGECSRYEEEMYGNMRELQEG